MILFPLPALDAGAYESASREDYLRAGEFAAPAFIENILKAIRMNTGVTTRS